MIGVAMTHRSWPTFPRVGVGSESSAVILSMRMGRTASEAGRWLLGLLLVGGACDDGENPGAWMPTSGGQSSTSGAEDTGSTSGTATVSTSGVDPVASTSGNSTGSTVTGQSGTETGTESSEGPAPQLDLPPLEDPLPQGFQLPFECGQGWRLDSWAHAPALDMVREPDQVGTDGATLLAPAPGTVNRSEFHENAGNLIQIDHGEGWFTTSVHLQSRAVEIGDTVERGQVIGAVGATGPTSNGHPHLHFELGFDADSSGSASWGVTDSERVNPWFDGVEYGQENGLTWRDVVSANCR